MLSGTANGPGLSLFKRFLGLSASLTQAHGKYGKLAFDSIFAFLHCENIKNIIQNSSFALTQSDGSGNPPIFNGGYL